jgi:hypothetical protein
MKWAIIRLNFTCPHKDANPPPGLAMNNVKPMKLIRHLSNAANSDFDFWRAYQTLSEFCRSSTLHLIGDALA